MENKDYKNEKKEKETEKKEKNIRETEKRERTVEEQEGLQTFQIFQQRSKSRLLFRH